jgi:divalent metal cation (Fe/Co/Zn/Cd) transporter
VAFSSADPERRERTALRVIAFSFFALAAYVTVESVRALVGADRAEYSDSTQTLLCTYLSAVLLVGLGVNSLFGWWWADPLAALVITAVAIKEGREAWRGDACCAPTPVALRPASAEPGDGCVDGCCTTDVVR